MMLFIDGVKYKLWTPKTEDDLERMVKEHAKDIFGNESLYLDLRQKLKSKAGIGSIPDGYVITFEDKPRWHIIEVELSSHPLYEHIVPQITRFTSGITNPHSQKLIIDAIDEEIRKDEVLKAWTRSKIGPEETYKFLSNLISHPPVITIIIDEKTDELEEVCRSLPGEKKIVEFKTFEREGVGLAVHAHLFEPLYEGKKGEERKVGWQGEGYTLVHVEGNYEVYKKEGEFSIEKLPSRKVVTRGLRSLEEAKRKVSALYRHKAEKAGKVTFQELANAGLVKDGQSLYFYYTKLFTDEQAQIILSSNSLRYKADGKTYSVSELAKRLLKKHGFMHGEYEVRGPKFWKTEDGELLVDLHEQIRGRRGDRK